MISICPGNFFCASQHLGREEVGGGRVRGTLEGARCGRGGAGVGKDRDCQEAKLETSVTQLASIRHDPSCTSTHRNNNELPICLCFTCHEQKQREERESNREKERTGTEGGNSKDKKSEDHK